ncbi:MAG TPA: MaoC family dehydratase N-terminal domain-containing protein [Casimicrobiaceae bacterium]
MTADGIDEGALRGWIGRSVRECDTLTAAPFALLSATLDRPADLPAAGTALPPLWHWLYFLPRHRQAELGPDGHARLGGFLPPVPLPRRMWAGSQLVFHRALRVGEHVTRTSSVEDVSVKRGRSGTLVFIKVRHDIAGEADGAPALTEHHDIVYRAASVVGVGVAATEPVRAPAVARWRRTIAPDAVLLLRYSALTFNGHRIHYDRQYATEVEAYPGLVVHGPLLATLLLDLVRREHADAQVTAFTFRALRPVFDLRPFDVCGAADVDARGARLWIADADGWLAMDAHATFA